MLTIVLAMGKPLLKFLFPRVYAFSNAKAMVHSGSQTSRNDVNRLLQHDPTIVCPDSRGNILFEMAVAGRIDMLRDALQCARQSLYDPRDMDMVWLSKKLAHTFGNLSTSEIGAALLCATAPMRTSRKLGPQSTSAFLSAAREGHTDVVMWMLDEGADVLQRQKDTGYTIIHMACLGGHSELLKELLSCQRLVQCLNGLQPLNMAVLQPYPGAHESTSTCLWVDVFALSRVTPLMLAAYHGHVECVRLLLVAGASMVVKTTGTAGLIMPRNSTALHCAARTGKYDACKLMLQSMYIQGGGAPGATENLPWERNVERDVRVVPNGVGAIPYSYAHWMLGNDTLSSLLDPNVPLFFVAVDPLDTPIGIPRLVALASEAVHRRLQDSLKAVKLELGSATNADPSLGPVSHALTGTSLNSCASSARVSKAFRTVALRLRLNSDSGLLDSRSSMAASEHISSSIGHTRNTSPCWISNALAQQSVPSILDTSIPTTSHATTHNQSGSIDSAMQRKSLCADPRPSVQMVDAANIHHTSRFDMLFSRRLGSTRDDESLALPVGTNLSFLGTTFNRAYDVNTPNSVLSHSGGSDDNRKSMHMTMLNSSGGGFRAPRGDCAAAAVSSSGLLGLSSAGSMNKSVNCTSVSGILHGDGGVALSDAQSETCCGICMDEVAGAGMSPCGHTICTLCAEELLNGVKLPMLCPFCRGSVDHFTLASQI